MYEDLHFRRQFLLTLSPIPQLAHWQCLQVAHHYIYAHPDLELNHVEDSKNTVVLFGSIFDPEAPEKGNADILKTISDDTNNITDLFLRIKGYAGRYALFYKEDHNAIILHDALALREIYYCTKDNNITCGSQPNLISMFASPEINPRTDFDFLEYYSKHLHESRWNPLNKWIGDETYYKDIKHLLPNHYLDINKHEADRYWPNAPIKRLNLDEAVARSCKFLQGSIKAIAHRHHIMMAVTAGTDSRTLLAASRDLKDNIYYFINNQDLGHSHPDLTVPKRIFENIGVPFHIHEVPKDVDNDFRKIFLNNTFFASARMLPTIYNVYFKNFNARVNILGIGEIGRTRYGKEPKKLNSYRLLYKLGHREGPYVIGQSEKILKELLPVGRAYGLNVLTLLYWEHTLGNWGTTGNSESDIAIEELNPYDSHLLYELLLGVDDRYTKYSNSILFKMIIQYMWPELLEWPINPPYKIRDRILTCFKKIKIFDALKELKYQMNYIKHCCSNKDTVKKHPKPLS